MINNAVVEIAHSALVNAKRVFPNGVLDIKGFNKGVPCPWTFVGTDVRKMVLTCRHSGVITSLKAVIKVNDREYEVFNLMDEDDSYISSDFLEDTDC